MASDPQGLERWTRSYGLIMPQELSPQVGIYINVTDGVNVTNVTGDG